MEGLFKSDDIYLLITIKFKCFAPFITTFMYLTCKLQF